MRAPRIELRVSGNADELAASAGAFAAHTVREAVRDHEGFAVAVSGGQTPWRFFEVLRASALPWSAIDVFQVDERIVPPGDPDRNLSRLEAVLPAGPTVHPMPVDASDLEAAADRYASELPERFDLIHLGLGSDGHTASLVPGDPVLEVRDRLVAVTSTYRGERRMTLTYPALERAMNVMWLVEGAEKAPALKRLLAHDPSIPAGRVATPSQIVFADSAAMTGRSD